MQPGTYQTSGPDWVDNGRTTAVGCYWAKIVLETRDVLSSNYTDGSDTVVLNEGDWFVTEGCSSWGVVR